MQDSIDAFETAAEEAAPGESSSLRARQKCGVIGDRIFQVEVRKTDDTRG